MILENAIDKWGYARLLIADYHLEYPLTGPDGTRVDLVWSPYEIRSIHESLAPGTELDTDSLARQMFPDLEKYYGHQRYGDFDYQTNLWLVQGDLNQIHQVFSNLARDLMGGSSGDDDTYDYWPNAFDALMELAMDLIKLRYPHTDYLISQVDNVIKSAIAINGPADTWEASELLDNAIDTLKEVASVNPHS